MNIADDIQQYSQALRTIFEHYASMGEPLNVTHLKGFKFNKLLLHSGILNVPFHQ
jgi:hypothetical protein